MRGWTRPARSTAVLSMIEPPNLPTHTESMTVSTESWSSWEQTRTPVRLWASPTTKSTRSLGRSTVRTAHLTEVPRRTTEPPGSTAQRRNHIDHLAGGVTDQLNPIRHASSGAWQSLSGIIWHL